MSYARYLEPRRGVYYFRQTVLVNGKQRARRLSLRTKDLHIAKRLAILLLANIYEMNEKKFEAQYNEQGQLTSLKVDGEDDYKLFQLTEKQRLESLAYTHKLEMERLALEKSLQEQEAQQQAADWQASDRATLLADLQATLPSKTTRQPVQTLRDMQGIYIDNGKWSNPQTSGKYRRTISDFIDFCDTKNVTTIHEVNRKLVGAYLMFLRNDEDMEDKTIQNRFYSLGSFYNWVKSTEDNLPSNPFAGHKLKYVDSPRIPFNTDDLNKIFSSEEVIADRRLFFISLILLTSGARPNEICQLYTDDVAHQSEHDFYTLRITKNEQRGQTLKTAQSDRLIYLHPLVIAHGFLDYLQDRAKVLKAQKQKEGFLFEVAHWKGTGRSASISYKYAELLKNLGIVEEGKVLYSFRHTAINRLYQQGQNIENLEVTVRDMIGHDEVKGKSTVDLHYREKLAPYLMKEKSEAILNYAEVSALHQQ